MGKKAAKMSLRKIGSKRVKAEKRLLKLRKQHNKTMMKMMPKGKGLRKALKRIQKAKLKKNKDEVRLAKQQKKLKKTLKKPKKADTSMLTKSARRLIRKEQFK